MYTHTALYVHTHVMFTGGASVHVLTENSE